MSLTVRTGPGTGENVAVTAAGSASCPMSFYTRPKKLSHDPQGAF